MMRKFPKLLAVVLAIAIIICPAMCLSSMAATANTYSISYADDAITVNVSAETGLLVALLRLDVLGYTVDEDNIEVVTDPAIDFSANPDYDAEAGTLSLLLAAKEATDVSLVNSATVTVPVAKDDTAAIQYIALNEVQAADAGTAEAPESFLAFEGVGEDGIIETPVIADCSHIDEDADNLCDACGEELETVCEHENLTYVNNNDGTHTATCADCGEFSETVAHTENGLCACGVDTRLQVAKISLAYGTSSLELNFRMLTNGVLNLYPKMEFVLVAQKYNKDTLNLETADAIVIDSTELVTAGKYKQYTYKDIQLYELALEINYIIKGYDADGNLVAVSDAEPFTAVGDLKGQIEDANKTEDFKRLMVDTLVVCDEVMNNVAASYPNSSLAAYVADNSVLDGIDTSLATQTIKTPNQVDTFNSFNANFTQASSATHRIRSSVAIGKVPYINFRIKDSNDALDRSKLTVTVAYTSKDSAGEHPYSKTFGVADFTDAGDYINLEFAEIGFHDSNKDIVFTVVYDGATVCDWTYSIETYLNSKQNDTTIGDQSIALIKLGQSFRTYQNLD